MNKDVSKKIENLTLELASIRGVVGTREENNVAEKVYETFNEMDYFKKHPKNVRFVNAIDDPLERKSVMAMIKGEKGNSKKTIVLVGHIDTVGISDYGLLKDYATKPLELVKKLKEVSIPEDALKDLESGEYLFGRGVFDMKCGVSTLMTIMEI